MSTPAAASADPERAPLLPNNSNNNANAEEADAVPQPLPVWRRKRAVIATAVLVVIGALVAAGVYLLLARPSSGGDGDDGPVLRYPNETIAWKACGDVDGRPLECATIDVPMDHFNASRSGNRTFSVPMVRLRGNSTATKNVLLNPGGPGGSGMDLIKRKGAAISDSLRGDFHLIGFEPRGIGRSRPQASCFADAKTRRTHGFRFNGDLNHDAALYDEAGNIAHACADHMAEFAPHINTPQTAADMNSILDAVGQDGLYYIGYSYGTALGATYANLFPERSERVVIDGVLNSFIWYNDLTIEDFFQDTDRVVDGFFDECSKAGERCPLSGYGRKGKDIRRNLTALLDRLEADGPMPVYINSTTFGTVSRRSVLGGIFAASYAPSRWYELADTLAQLISGNGTAALLRFPDRDPADDGEEPADEANFFVTANDAPSGHPTWPDARDDVLDILLPDARRGVDWMLPDLSTGMLRAQWLVPKGHNFKPRKNVKTRHPVLVMSTTYDPVCPLASAKIMRDSFVGSKLIEVEGYGHCSIAIPSKCANGHLHAYMVNGTLPEWNLTKCPVDDKYFLNPEDEKKDKDGEAKVAGVEEEEDALLAALRSLSDAVPELRL